MRQALPWPALAALTLAAATSTARAQAPRLDELVRTDPFSNDPIGVDATNDVARVPGPPAPPAPETAEEIARRGPTPPDVAVHGGEALTAISGVRETAHAVEVDVADGLARVLVSARFANRARHPAEIRYRLAVPEDAALSALEVCRGDRCRPGIEVGAGSAYDEAVRARGPAGGAPVAHAERVRDERGAAILVRVAPVTREEEVALRVRYLAATERAAGVLRFTLPPRGHDPRLAESSVTVRAPGLLGVAIDGVAEETRTDIDPWLPVEVMARAPTGAPPRAAITRAPCARTTCARVVVSSGPREGTPVDLVLALDVSPSMEGPARGRVGAALAGLFSALPARSRVRVLAFAAEARPLVEEWTDPSDVPLVPLARAAQESLGSATRFEAVWNVASSWLEERERDATPMIVVVGDGGISTGDAATDAFSSARREGVVVSSVDLADRATWAALREGVESTGGVALEVSRVADLAARGHAAAPLEERLTRLFAPRLSRAVTVRAGGRTIALGALHAGEELVWEGELARGRDRVSLVGLDARPSVARVAPEDAIGLAARARGTAIALAAIDPEDLTAPREHELACVDARGPPARRSGVSSDASPVALAEPRACGTARDATGRASAGAPSRPATTATTIGRAPERGEGRGIPRETVLSMLRQRVHPVARQCFRRDRAGRGDYAVRAEFEVRLTDREVESAEVRGRITDALRTCLFDAVHSLDVPRFSGTVIVRYPLVTERVPPPPVIELAPEVAREVDRVAGEGE